MSLELESECQREAGLGEYEVIKSPNQMRAARELSYMRSMLRESIHMNTEITKCLRAHTHIQFFFITGVKNILFIF